MTIKAAAVLFSVVLIMCLHQSLLLIRASEKVPEIMANVSLLLARHFNIQCMEIIHSENLMLSGLNLLYLMLRYLGSLPSGLMTGTMTFKKYIKHSHNNFENKTCQRSLKILSDLTHGRESSEKYAGIFRYIEEFPKGQDSIWILFSPTLSTNFFKSRIVDFDNFVIVAVLKTSAMIKFYEIYKVAKETPLRIQIYGNWTTEEGINLVKKPFYDRRSDLEGVLIRTASVVNWPATYRTNGQWRGFLIKLWNEIVSLINCTTVDVSNPDENFIGLRMPNGTWNGLIGRAVRHEIDVILSEIVIDSEKSRVISFLFPMWKSRFQIYTRHQGFEWQWSSVLKPFPIDVWLATTIWIVIAAIFLCISFKIGCKYEVEPEKQQDPFNFLNSFFFQIGSLCQQGSSIVPSSCACRIIMIASYMVSGVLVPLYSASLVSSLAKKEKYESVTSIQDMLNSGKYDLLVKSESPEQAFFLHTENEFLRFAYDKLTKNIPQQLLKLKRSELINLVCGSPQLALFGIQESIEVRYQRLYRPKCAIVPLKEPVSSLHLSIATSKKNPFWGLINYKLRSLIVSGVVDRLKEAESPLIHHTAKLAESQEIDLRQMISPFAFISLSILISVLILVVENLCHFYRDRKTVSRRKKHVYKDPVLMNFKYKIKNQPKLHHLV